jgi:hypothetical protein
MTDLNKSYFWTIPTDSLFVQLEDGLWAFNISSSSEHFPIYFKGCAKLNHLATTTTTRL